MRGVGRRLASAPDAPVACHRPSRNHAWIRKVRCALRPERVPTPDTPTPTPAVMKLVLFDIDGTILWTDGVGRRAIHAALVEIFGGTGPESYWFDGKTDRQIVRDLMRLEGHADDHIDARMDDLLDRYVTYLEQELSRPEHRPRLYDGVERLIDALDARDDVVLGLLTGNLERGARVKLAAVGIDPNRFTINAFGSDSEHRPELPAIAQRRARERLGLDLPGDAVV